LTRMGSQESMKAYSEDLRRKIVDAVRRGTSKRETASLFGVGLSSVKRLARMEREGDSLAPKKPPGRPPKGTDARGARARSSGRGAR
jgi:transposase